MALGCLEEERGCLDGEQEGYANAKSALRS